MANLNLAAGLEAPAVPIELYLTPRIQVNYE
jgi:hypothetical protein